MNRDIKPVIEKQKEIYSFATKKSFKYSLPKKDTLAYNLSNT